MYSPEVFSSSAASLSSSSRLVRADEIASRAEHLSQLDKRGAKFRHRHAHLHLRAHIADLLTVRAEQPVLQPRVIKTAKQIRETILPEHGGDFAKPFRMTFESGEGVDFHREWLTPETFIGIREPSPAKTAPGLPLRSVRPLDKGCLSQLPGITRRADGHGLGLLGPRH